MKLNDMQVARTFPHSRKGRPNRYTARVKSNVLAVFDRIGGRDKMCEWAKENLTEFYKIYSRLLPTEVVADVNVRDASQLSDTELISIIEGSCIGVDEEEEQSEVDVSVHRLSGPGLPASEASPASDLTFGGS